MKPNSNIDYRELEDRLLKRTYKLSEVKDKIEKVAFDIVRFKDDDKGTALWQVQSAEDGNDYIVVLYEEPEQEKKSSWEVIMSKTSNVVDFFYKGDPITKIASNKLGIPESDLNLAIRYLPNKLSENKNLVNALLNQLPEPAKNAVYSKYPELQ